MFPSQEYSPAKFRASTGKPVYLRGSIVGQIIGDTFRRSISPDKHLLRRMGNAICTHVEVLRQIENERVEWLHCVVSGNQAYGTSGDLWLSLGELKRIGIKVTDPRHGQQIAVPIKHWRAERATTAEAERPPEWAQGTLL